MIVTLKPSRRTRGPHSRCHLRNAPSESSSTCPPERKAFPSLTAAWRCCTRSGRGRTRSSPATRSSSGPGGSVNSAPSPADNDHRLQGGELLLSLFVPPAAVGLRNASLRLMPHGTPELIALDTIRANKVLEGWRAIKWPNWFAIPNPLGESMAPIRAQSNSCRLSGQRAGRKAQPSGPHEERNMPWEHVIWSRSRGLLRALPMSRPGRART